VHLHSHRLLVLVQVQVSNLLADTGIAHLHLRCAHAQVQVSPQRARPAMTQHFFLSYP
jgi:hypothetical protein